MDIVRASLEQGLVAVGPRSDRPARGTAGTCDSSGSALARPHGADVAGLGLLERREV